MRGATLMLEFIAHFAGGKRKWHCLTSFENIQVDSRLSELLRMPRGLVVRSRLWGRRAVGSKPDSAEYPSCMWAWCTLNLTSWVKRPPAVVVQNFGGGWQHRYRPRHLTPLRRQSQNSSRVASKRDVNIIKLISTVTCQ
ncbi:hypothetical protein AVEN_236260-1 [Araneus ventricosus]|uniref:Uncharacterized protein n=1 Tax=Araneus ventricosus TaxID=182803 RepID=A0A4Y2NCZ8_ARAVE|nr:hypothetical protein AVEN_236260-1 [Araneus ventricosus]